MYIYDVENPICLSCCGARSERRHGCASLEMRLDGEITRDDAVEDMSTHGCAQDEKADGADTMRRKP